MGSHLEAQSTHDLGKSSVPSLRSGSCRSSRGAGRGRCVDPGPPPDPRRDEASRAAGAFESVRARFGPSSGRATRRVPAETLHGLRARYVVRVDQASGCDRDEAFEWRFLAGWCWARVDWTCRRASAHAGVARPRGAAGRGGGGDLEDLVGQLPGLVLAPAAGRLRSGGTPTETMNGIGVVERWTARCGSNGLVGQEIASTGSREQDGCAPAHRVGGRADGAGDPAPRRAQPAHSGASHPPRCRA